MKSYPVDQQGVFLQRLLFTRAFSKTFSRGKLLLTSVFLLLCGSFFVFCQGASVHSGDWIALSLLFLPVFASAGALLSLGILLIRIYHDEVKERVVSYRKVLEKSWETALGASYFCVPIVLTYLLMWMLLGVFLLLREIPSMGEVIAVLLAFGPFLINLVSILLCLLTVVVLFLAAPAIALKSFDPIAVWQVIQDRVEKDPLQVLVDGLIALTPLALATAVLSLSVAMTDGMIYTSESTTLVMAMSWFVMMIPFAALLSPAVVFFFNYSAEAHVASKRQTKKIQS